MHVKFSSTSASLLVILAVTACFWTIGMFGVGRYCFSLQQYNERQQFLLFLNCMGACSLGSLLGTVIWVLLFFCTHVPCLLQLYSEFGFLVSILIQMQITNWIHHGCDERKEEEGSLKKKDEGEMTTV
jgi:hypothetical protein